MILRIFFWLGFHLLLSSIWAIFFFEQKEIHAFLFHVCIATAIAMTFQYLIFEIFDKIWNKEKNENV